MSNAQDGLPKNLDLAKQLNTTALAFRGYNVTNLGRSAEFLAHAQYGPIVKQYLRDAGEICSDITGTRADLVSRVKRCREPSLRNYAQAIALIVAMEMAQIRLLEEFHQINVRQSKLAFGYSLGELTAVACGGLFSMAEVLNVPLAMAQDCAEMAKGTTMGVLFSRGPALVEEDVVRLMPPNQCRRKWRDWDFLSTVA